MNNSVVNKRIHAAAVMLTVAASVSMIRAEDHIVEGNAKSAVRVIAYEDLQCSDCAVYRRMMDEKLLPKYGGLVAFEHRDFPLQKHAWAKRAAIAARYFDSVDASLGVQFRQWAMANQSKISADTVEAEVAAWAKSHKQDPAHVKAALSDSKLAKLVDEDYEEGVARGVARTPTVFVNGEPFIETFTSEEISRAIDSAVAATRK